MTAPYPINVNIPNAPNNPADDQPIMKQNYANISGFLAVDHIAPGTATTAGIHNQVRLPNKTAPGFAPGAGVLFANLGNGNSWPFWQNAKGTFPLLGSATAPVTPGFAVLPGGIIMQWGTVSLPSQTATTITFPTPFSAAPFSIQQTLIFPSADSGNRSVYVKSSAAANFVSFCTSSSTFSAFWLAIGPQ